MLAEVREHPRQQRQADGSEHEAERATRRRGRARGAARPRDAKACLGASSAWLITWTSMPTPDSRITRLITDPRVSSLPARAAASRRARSASRSASARPSSERRRRRRRRRPRGSAAELLDELALPLEQLGRRRGEPVLGDARGRRRGRPSTRWPSAPPAGPGARRPASRSARRRRARASPRARSMPCRARYSASASSTRSATQSEGELAQRAEVAGPEVVRRARRRSARPDRCCRAPSGGGAPRASCRRARSGRRGARPRRGSSRAAGRR